VTEHEEKKSSNGDSIDLDARARVIFAATAEDIEEESNWTHQEGLSDEELRSYLEDITNEVKNEETSRKVKNTRNQIQ
jgi:hypothetical protein